MARKGTGPYLPFDICLILVFRIVLVSVYPLILDRSPLTYGQRSISSFNRLLHRMMKGRNETITMRETSTRTLSLS